MSILNGKYRPVVFVNPDSHDSYGHMLDLLCALMEEVAEDDPYLNKILELVSEASVVYQAYQETVDD